MRYSTAIFGRSQGNYAQFVTYLVFPHTNKLWIVMNRDAEKRQAYQDNKARYLVALQRMSSPLERKETSARERNKRSGAAMSCIAQIRPTRKGNFLSFQINTALTRCFGGAPLALDLCLQCNSGRSVLAIFCNSSIY